jgi:cyclopropane fatty-acyl-phospholipid synthase-like methyltransferase
VIHHLDASSKRRFFKAVHRVLHPSGRFLLVDVARREGENRDAYLDRYMEGVRHWTILDERRFAEVHAHITGYDFPEPLPDLLAMGSEAGFVRARLEGSFGDHHVLSYPKA